MALHKNLTSADIHILPAFSYADATSRANAMGLLATDVGKLAVQEDDKSYWILKDHSPVTWTGVGTDWVSVSEALGGQAGAYANRVFKSDGAGAGSMVANTQVISRRVLVGLGGDVDYTSIADAITAAIAGGASGTNPWEIRICPGTYTESPMTIQSGINLVADLGERPETVNVVAANAAADLFTVSGGTISGLRASGVTDASYCLFRCATYGSAISLRGISVRGCSKGVVVSNGATVVIGNFGCSITSPGQGVGTAVEATGTGSYVIIVGGTALVPAALLPAYASNPIQTCFRVASSAKCYVSGLSAQVAYKDSTADVFLADGGSSVIVAGCDFRECNNCLHIGSSGSDTNITATGTFTGNILNVYIESSTGIVFANFSTDERRNSLVTGASITGVIQYRSQRLLRILGEAKYSYTTNKDVDLADYFYDFSSTGKCENGKVTVYSGLIVDVPAGEGFIRRPDDGDVETVEWEADQLTLTASTTNYVFYNSVSGLLASDTAAPSRDTAILLATVVTDGSGVRFIHDTYTNVEDGTGRLADYLEATRPFMLNTGLAVTQGTGVRKLNVDAGSYYHSLSLIAYAGSGGDATWSYFYGTNGATEVASQTSLNITQYDNAGTLATMTSDYYRSDTLFLTSDGRISVVYGTAQYATALLAEAASVANVPTFIEPSACILAQIIVRQNVGIDSVIDRRPRSAGSGASSGGVSIHSALAGLSADDHTQYLLVGGTRAMGGSLNMGSYNITSVGSVDGVTVSAHASRHNPGGTDAVSTGTPTAVLVGASAAAGTASSLVRSDHQHGVAAGITPASVGTANAEGSSSSVARADHVHNHGAQTSGTLHAAVIAASTSGFMTGADKTKLDGIASGATNSPFTSTAPVNVTKATAAVGTAVEAARQDHKHDVTTAAPSSLSAGGSNTEGTNTSLARSDHIHQLPAYGTGAGTICQGNDSRLADDRTASGLRSATTVVSVSSATAPTTGQILTATSGTAATWQTPGAASTTLRQSVFANITANTTTTSTSFVDLISQAITVGSGAYLIIHAAGAFSNSSTVANMKCRITVDGVTAGGVQLRAGALNIGNSWAMVYRLSVAEGTRTVALQWLTSTGTAQCRPVANADGESASLLIEEVTV